MLLFITLLAWAFASPVGSTPDDDFHLPSIWCGLGEREGICEPSADPDTRLVPGSLLSASCYAFRPGESAGCWDPAETELKEAVRLNTSSLYPPLFYGTMSIFAGPDIQTSVILMRAANSALAVGLLTLAFWSLPRGLRPALVISTVGAAVPLGLFVIPSTNPSSWTFISAALVWICLYGATQSNGGRQLRLAALATLGAILGAGARADSAAFAVFAVLVAAILGLRLSRSMTVPLVSGVAITLLSTALFLSARQSGSVVSGISTGNPPLSMSQHFFNLLNVPSLWIGAYGGWGLGWLDTILPTVVSVAGFGVACGALFLGIRYLTARRAVALALALVALWGVPFVLLAQSQAIVGTEVQPRYLLPLLVIFLGVATAGPHAIGSWRGSRSVLAGLALGVSASVSLHVNLRRYTTGTDDPAIDPGTRAEWWWVGLPGPLVMWALGSLAFAVALLLLAYLPTWRQLTATGPPEDGASFKTTARSGV